MKDRLWADCSPSSKTCEIANVLQFSTGENGQTWLAKCSENKIGSIAQKNNKNNQLPFSVSASPQDLTLRTGQSVKIKLNISTTRVSCLPYPSNVNNEMIITSCTFTPAGDLGNYTGSFSEQSFSLESIHTKQVSIIFTPSIDLGQKNIRQCFIYKMMR